MVTFVGMQNDYAAALKDLIELEYDATEAYEVALHKIEDEEHKDKIAEFIQDHLTHIQKISELLESHNEEAPDGPSTLNQWITKGKVFFGNLIGDKSILLALRSNEIDTNYAYERLMYHENIWPDAESIIRQGMEDERKHKKWLEETLSIK